jgi:hypothetical protein
MLHAWKKRRNMRLKHWLFDLDMALIEGRIRAFVVTAVR